MLTVDFSRARLAKGMRLLDLGCGGGRHTFAALRRGADVVALDAKSSEVVAVKEMIEAIADAGELTEAVSSGGTVADITELPFASASFDRVIASEVLEHLSDDEAALREIARVLRPNGVVALSVPRAGPERANWLLSEAYHSVEGGHVRIYRRRELAARCSRAGLKVIRSHHAHALHSPYWLLKCAVGVDRDDHLLVRAYHRLLIWDITRRPLITRLIEQLLNPLIGKSLVVYLEKAR